MRRTGDWLKQAEAALAQAKDSTQGGHYWAACFFSHQAAEYAAKALLASRGVEARGHSIYDLLEEIARIGPAVDSKSMEYARNLDRHYLQSRYPNTLHTGAPVDYYRRSDAEKAVSEAQEIVEYCRAKAGQA